MKKKFITSILSLCVLTITAVKAQSIYSHNDMFGAFYLYPCNEDSMTVFVSPVTSGLTVQFDFGDGTSATVPLFLSGSIGWAGANHPYSSYGTFTVKEVLYNGTMALDSVSYSNLVS